MLGNNADAFYMTPIPTSVTTQAAHASRKAEMPAPRPMNQSATVTAVERHSGYIPGLGMSPAEMLPGMGNHRDMLPGMGYNDMLPGMGQFNIPAWGWGAIAIGAFVMLRGNRWKPRTYRNRARRKARRR